MTAFAPTAEFTKRHEMQRLRAEIERLRRENEKLAALAYRDALTGLRNRRVFTERLGEELSRLKRNPSGALSVIVIDVNDFKRLNDTDGHAAGDLALRAVAELLESLVRAEDFVCRVGGDEFVVLLPDTGLEQAAVVAERLRAHAPALARTGLGARPLSIGVSSWRVGDDECSLLSRADEEMYADKRSRRCARMGIANSLVRAA